MEDPRLLLVSAALLVYALISGKLGKWWISMPAAMLLVGVAVGPLGLKLIDLSAHSELVKTTAEITLSLMLFHDAVRIDLRALKRGYHLPLRLLGIGLPLMLVFGAAVAYGMLPAFGLVGAALLSTMLAPTDAALGEAVVSDERLPVRIRQGLNVESGLNDGLSVPVFLVLLAFASDPTALHTHALLTELVRQIGFGVLAGAVVGGGGGWLFRLAADHDLMSREWRRIAVLALALSCFTSAAVLGGSGFIGAFTGGIMFGLASEARSPEDNAFTAYLGTVFDAVSFILVGAVLLPLAWAYLSWQGVLYAVVSLVVIRMVAVALAMIGGGARRQTVAFMGWFGPRGLATLVFAVLLIDANIPNGSAIAAVAIAGVVLSVFAHGLSAPPLVAAYASWWNRLAQGGPPPMEAEKVSLDPRRLQKPDNIHG